MKRAWPLPVILVGGVLAILVSFALAGCAGAGDKTQATPESVVETFIQAYQAKDAETLLKLYWGSSQEDFENLQDVIQITEVTGYSIESTEHLSENEALVMVMIDFTIFDTSEEALSVFHVARKDDKWFIIDIAASE